MYKFEFEYIPAVRWVLALGHAKCSVLEQYAGQQVRVVFGT